jgi:hypothetical protein
LDFGFRVWGVESGVWGLEFWVRGLGFIEFGVYRFWNLGLRV